MNFIMDVKEFCMEKRVGSDGEEGTEKNLMRDILGLAFKRQNNLYSKFGVKIFRYASNIMKIFFLVKGFSG